MPGVVEVEAIAQQQAQEALEEVETVVLLELLGQTHRLQIAEAVVEVGVLVRPPEGTEVLES